MPDLDQIKQAEQGVRDRRGRFAKAWTPGAGYACEPHGLPGMMILPLKRGDFSPLYSCGSGGFYHCH
jgi:hypothetical protein